MSGAAYVVLGPLAAAVTGFAGAAPLLIETVAGLALLGALHGAMAVPEEREAALVTFLVTASGLGFGGVSGAFWGLLAGGALLLAIRLRAQLGH